jgi:hypothetical protein
MRHGGSDPLARDYGGSYLVDLHEICATRGTQVRRINGLSFSKQHTAYVMAARGSKKSKATLAAEADAFFADKTSEWARIVPMSERRRT